jgi:hypothetical protein
MHPYVLDQGSRMRPRLACAMLLLWVGRPISACRQGLLLRTALPTMINEIAVRDSLNGDLLSVGGTTLK